MNDIRNRPSRLFYAVPLTLLVAAGVLAWPQLSRSTGAALGGTDQNDPRRFRREGSFVVDSATGVRRPYIDGATLEFSFQRNLDRSSGALAANRIADAAAIADDLRFGQGPRPVRLLSSAINLSTEVVPIGVDRDRAIAVPTRADVAGWWSGGFIPGETGPTVIVGHYDSKVSAGVFARLKNLRVGDIVAVVLSDGSIFDYRVTEVEQLKKTTFPTNRVYGSDGTSTLRIVTCGGDFDRSTGHYVDNIISYLDLVVRPPELRADRPLRADTPNEEVSASGLVSSEGFFPGNADPAGADRLPTTTTTTTSSVGTSTSTTSLPAPVVPSTLPGTTTTSLTRPSVAPAPTPPSSAAPSTITPPSLPSSVPAAPPIPEPTEPSAVTVPPVSSGEPVPIDR